MTTLLRPVLYCSTVVVFVPTAVVAAITSGTFMGWYCGSSKGYKELNPTLLYSGMAPGNKPGQYHGIHVPSYIAGRALSVTNRVVYFSMARV